MRGSHGWNEIGADEKRAIIDAIVTGKAPKGPLHLELDLTDRCNVDCYFCNQMDVRTKEQIPYERIVEILDDCTPNGLRSVRLAGGGDPLFHREIDEVIDYIHAKGLVIDNITTNGVGLSAGVAQRLVAGRTRELLISLNAADPADYHRMMQVKPALFEKVVGNVEHLVSLRARGELPSITVQFLLDRENYDKLPAMYELGRRMGADVIAVNLVIEIPHDRIDHGILLLEGDKELLRPLLREVIAADRGRDLLQICFHLHELNAMLEEVEREVGSRVNPGFSTASTYREENGQCFFGYYSAVVRGNGDMYPCCMLMNPDYKPLGNGMKGAFIKEKWNGPEFTQLRGEMREVMLAGGEIEYQEGKFATLGPQCVNAHACGLKNMYFRSDEDFYRDLGTALEQVRKREVRLLGNRQQTARALHRLKVRHPRLRHAYDRLVASAPRLRAMVKRYLSVRT
ncbi:MAG: mftC 1 [Acidobacteria bacterium]|nr:mftC 1 [Acidobacteriota bacterium]